jgi:hypothetical protein
MQIDVRCAVRTRLVCSASHLPLSSQCTRVVSIAGTGYTLHESPLSQITSSIYLYRLSVEPRAPLPLCRPLVLPIPPPPPPIECRGPALLLVACSYSAKLE